MLRCYMLIALFVGSAQASAQDKSQCSPRGIDVCATASRLSREAALSLPMRVNANMTITQIFSTKNLIVMSVLLAYDRKHLESVMKANSVPLERIHEGMRNWAKSSLCVPGGTMESFLNSGGIVENQYRFVDGTLFWSYRTANC